MLCSYQCLILVPRTVVLGRLDVAESGPQFPVWELRVQVEEAEGVVVGELGRRTLEHEEGLQS